MSTPLTYDDDAVNVPATSRSGGSLEGLPAVDASGETGISPAIISLITHTVRAALAAERADNPPGLYTAASKCFEPIGSLDRDECLFRGRCSSAVQLNARLFDRWCWSSRAVAFR